MRVVQANQTTILQADFFQGDGFTRVPGITKTQLSLDLFFNNALQVWPLVDGLTVTDAQIASGRVYFNEIASSPGYYSVRFRPDAVGYWRCILTYFTVPQIVACDVDVLPASSLVPGTTASFIKTGSCG